MAKNMNGLEEVMEEKGTKRFFPQKHELNFFMIANAVGIAEQLIAPTSIYEAEFYVKSLPITLAGTIGGLLGYIKYETPIKFGLIGGLGYLSGKTFIEYL